MLLLCCTTHTDIETREMYYFINRSSERITEVKYAASANIETIHKGSGKGLKDELVFTSGKMQLTAELRDILYHT